MLNYILYALWAFAAGVVIPVMATFNAQLARSIGSPPAAVALLFGVAFLTALVYLLSARTPLPDISTLLSTKRYLFTGGLMTAFYVISVTILIPKFGVGNTILFVVCAQMCSSAIIDNWGLFGVPVRPVSWLRLAGLVVIFVGLVLVQLGAAKGNGE